MRVAPSGPKARSNSASSQYGREAGYGLFLLVRPPREAVHDAQHQRLGARIHAELRQKLQHGTEMADDEARRVEAHGFEPVAHHC
jgi:hypothetical protein